MLNLDKLRAEQAEVVKTAEAEIELCKERLAETRKRLGVALARPAEIAETERRLTAERQAALVGFDAATLAKCDKLLRALPASRAENEKEIADCKLIIEGLEAKVVAKTRHRDDAIKACARVDLQAKYSAINKAVSALADALREAAPLAQAGDCREFFGILPDFLVVFEPFAESEITSPDFKKVNFKYCYDRRFPFTKGDK